MTSNTGKLDNYWISSIQFNMNMKLTLIKKQKLKSSKYYTGIQVICVFFVLPKISCFVTWWLLIKHYTRYSSLIRPTKTKVGCTVYEDLSSI